MTVNLSLKEQYLSEHLCLSLSLYSKFEDMTVNLSLKEQYPVMAHPPNFDFWTGCSEIKRCEKSKRTLQKSVCIGLGRVLYYTKTSQITDQ